MMPSNKAICIEGIHLKTQAWELTKSKVTWHQFKASKGWRVCVIQRNRFSLHRETSLFQKLPADFMEKT